MTSFEELKRIAISCGADVCEDEPMSRHTTFKIGGPADIYIKTSDENAVLKIEGFCADNGIPILALGNGSNLLVSDKGIEGAVLRYCGGSIRREGEKIVCPSGIPLRNLCEEARDMSLSGLEFAYGIPGTVGGAVYMNAGAYGGEMKDAVLSSEHSDKGKRVCFKGAELEFGYRKSAYTGKKFIILNAVFSLKTGNKSEIEAKMADLMNRRKTKQPLDMPSAGSVFKRPEGHFAGTLIEKCGLKGLKSGGAMVSLKHAGFIVNAGGATCDDVLRLVGKIQDEVMRRAGVALECEIKAVGRK